MSTQAHNRLPSDAPTDRLERLHDEVPEIPDSWELIDRDELTFNARAGWEHEETGQVVTVHSNRRPTQMHTPETSTDDTGFNARVQPDRSGKHRRDLTYELGSKDCAYAGAIRFMATYPDGEYEIPAPDVWEYGEPCDWEADDE